MNTEDLLLSGDIPDTIHPTLKEYRETINSLLQAGLSVYEIGWAASQMAFAFDYGFAAPTNPEWYMTQLGKKSRKKTGS